MNRPLARPHPPDAPKSGRVLVVDDDCSVRAFVAAVVAQCDGHAVSAAGVEEALALLARDTYDVAFVDLHMPHRSGLELLDALTAAGQPTVPILLTGTTDVAVAVEGMKRGAFDYVAKPVTPDALRWAFERALQVADARQRERALEVVVAEWAATFDACPDVLLILDADGHVLSANEAAVRAAGAAESLVGEGVGNLFPGGLGEAIRVRLRTAQASGASDDPVPASKREFDTILDAHFLVSVTPIRTAAGAWAVVARDVTQLVRGEEERKQLLRRVLTAQEEERGRLARELHDSVGQALVSVAVGLDGIEPDPVVTASAARDRLQRVQQIAKESLEEVRRLSHGLRPAVLDDLGLAAALARLTGVFSRIHGVRAELIVPGGLTERLPKEIESAVYRIAQEALTNVAKHARARTVDVVLETEGGAVRLSVVDDGCGFQTDDRLLRSASYGLSGMRERAGLLGGSFHVTSAAGRGTTLEVRIPLLGGET